MATDTKRMRKMAYRNVLFIVGNIVIMSFILLLNVKANYLLKLSGFANILQLYSWLLSMLALNIFSLRKLLWVDYLNSLTHHEMHLWILVVWLSVRCKIFKLCMTKRKPNSISWYQVYLARSETRQTGSKILAIHTLCLASPDKVGIRRHYYYGLLYITHDHGYHATFPCYARAC